MARMEQSDGLEELERLDRFFDGEEPGERPLEVLRERGMEIPDEASLSDTDVHAKLWELIEAMAGLGLYLESTDHLSDRELYRYLVGNALMEETCLSEGGAGGWHISPIGGFSSEDIEIYLRYYADEETRQDWDDDPTTPIPPHEKLPFDRDRMLPGHCG
jgi:hypothetical protein